MSAPHAMAAGLPELVHASQQTFRAVLDALARPGQIRHIGTALPEVNLGGAAARLLLSLCDDETSVWWQSANIPLQSWLQFHTGARVASEPQMASFAVLSQLEINPTLADFAMGSAESPEFSTTLFIELPALQGGVELEWRGPGIQDEQRVDLLGVPSSFWTQWQANHAGFPRGVDIVFTCGEHAMGLPRSTRVRRLEGV
jgi:alpha-D-ribose 1-methylphosphonate 5-triphosphate synthase subunit PhnH